MQLSKNERFLNEYNTFKEKINNISDNVVKENLNKLLAQLVSEVKAIDRMHTDTSSILQLANNETNYRSNLTALRKKIHTALSNYK
jgi:hypothetical protein